MSAPVRPRVHIYTGDGKGKTTAALGLCLRFVGSGGKACLIQFDKGGEAGLYSERATFSALPGLTHVATGLGRFDPVEQTFRFKNLPGDIAEAQRGLQAAKAALRESYGLLVLDELLSLPLTGLADEAAVEGLLDAYEQAGRPCELVLTGHKIWPALQQRSDLVTEMRKIKHYFETGSEARKGIEF